MSVKEIAIHVKNAPGQLAHVTAILAETGLSIRGITASSAGKQGWVRFVVNDADRAVAALDNHGFSVEIGEAVAVLLEDKPGHLDTALRALNDEKINIDYIYTAHCHDSLRLAAVLGVQTPTKVEQILEQHGLTLLAE